MSVVPETPFGICRLSLVICSSLDCFFTPPPSPTPLPHALSLSFVVIATASSNTTKKKKRNSKEPSSVIPNLMNSLEEVPDLLLHIFKFLGPHELCLVQRVCILWRDVARQGTLWKVETLALYNSNKQSMSDSEWAVQKDKEVEWKEHYVQRYQTWFKSVDPFYCPTLTL